MSQAVLADRANEEIFRTTGHPGALSARSISDLERGWYSWPARQTRDALCAVLGKNDPAELGFVPRRRQRQPSARPDAVPVAGNATIVLDSEDNAMGPLGRRTFLLGGAAAVGGMLGTRPVTVGWRDDLGVATAVAERWPDVRVSRPVPDRAVDWQLDLPGGQAYDGATTQLQTHRISSTNGTAVLVEPPPRRFHQFTRRRRGLVVAADENDDGPLLYGVSANDAARQAARRAASPTIVIPQAYLLDDLTYGALWAATNLDEALLTDDGPLDTYRRDFLGYDGLAQSQVHADSAADLSTVSRMWLGSDFCARHIARNIDSLPTSPAYWTREQRGEEAATWLLWRHKLAYLRRTRPPGNESSSRGFCVPETVTSASPPHERTLMFLTAALMEAHGFTVQITADPAYGAVEGFVFGGRAIIANWVRDDGLWHVDIATGGPSKVTDFRETLGHARAATIAPGRTPHERLQAIADYVQLPYPWLRARCAQLAPIGLGRLIAPRSRFISTDGIDIALRFVAGLPV